MTKKEFSELSNLSLLSVEVHQVCQKLETIVPAIEKMGSKKEIKCALRALEALVTINDFIVARYTKMQKQLVDEK